MFMSGHSLFDKYRLINSVRHLSVLHTTLAHCFALSIPDRRYGPVQLGKVSMQLFVLAVAANSCKMRREQSLLSPWLSSFPDTLALLTQMSSSPTERERGGKESGEESCIYFFLSGVPTPCIASAIYQCVWMHICIRTWNACWCMGTSLLLSIDFLVRPGPDAAGGRTDLSALSPLVADACWITTSDL